MAYGAILGQKPPSPDPPYKVGDTLTTVRTDLGEKWLLCNGDKVIRTDYPDLAELIPANLNSAWTEKTLWTSGRSDSGINCITYKNGYLVAGGIDYDGSYAFKIAYTTDIDSGSWSTKSLTSSSVNSQVTGIDYGDGYWVASIRTGNISYTSIGLSDVWSLKSISAMDEINDIIYADGYWVICGQYNDGNTYFARIAYTTKPTGSWTTKDLWSGTNASNRLRCITYADGKWVVGGSNGNTYETAIAYSTTLDGNWTIKTLWDNNNNMQGVYQILYADDKWVAVGQSYNNSIYLARLAYSTNIDGPWTTKDLWSSNSTVSGSTMTKLSGVAYADGYWLVGGHYFLSNSYGRIAYSTSLDGEWTQKNIWDTSGSTVLCVAYADGNFVVGGYDKTSNDVVYYAVSYITLPTITTDGAYNYIKAEE